MQQLFGRLVMRRRNTEEQLPAEKSCCKNLKGDGLPRMLCNILGGCMRSSAVDEPAFWSTKFDALGSVPRDHAAAMQHRKPTPPSGNTCPTALDGPRTLAPRCKCEAAEDDDSAICDLMSSNGLASTDMNALVVHLRGALMDIYHTLQCALRPTSGESDGLAVVADGELVMDALKRVKDALSMSTPVECCKRSSSSDRRKSSIDLCAPSVIEAEAIVTNLPSEVTRIDSSDETVMGGHTTRSARDDDADGCTTTVTVGATPTSIPVLDPFNERLPSGFKLVRVSEAPCYVSVWCAKLQTRSGKEQKVAIKVKPCHSQQRAGELLKYAETSGERTFVFKEENALREVRKAAEIACASAAFQARATFDAAHAPTFQDVFVQPLQVFVRHCSMPSEDTTCDLEVVALYPWFEAGDARTYLWQRMCGFMEQLRSDSESMMAAVDEIADGLYGFGLDMLSLVHRVHQVDHVLNDHKPENMIFDEQAGCFKLIDAEALSRCSKCGKSTARGLSTPGYAAPEQEQGEQSWCDRRSDVYACGRSLLLVLQDSQVLLKHILGHDPDRWQHAHGCLLAATEALGKLAEQCTAAEPAARPSGEQALEWLRRLQLEYY